MREFMELKKNPTGIESFDAILDGGLPAGSLILLLGEIGAGDFEFALTTMSRLLMSGKDRNKRVCYISMTRGKEDFMKEIAFSFPAFFKILDDRINQDFFEFKDFSDAYFARSFVPQTWISSERAETSFESLKWNDEKKNLIPTLIEYLETNADESIVIIDSLTALAQYCLMRMEWKDLILFLRGLQRGAKKWNGIVYAILSEGIFEGRKEEEISECMDGVIVFNWDKTGHSHRQRIMFIKKLRGVLPALDRNNIVNFETIISSQKGFEISNIKRVMGS